MTIKGTKRLLEFLVKYRNVVTIKTILLYLFWHCCPLQYYVHIGERKIKELGVRCVSMERGCEWTGTIGTLDNHIATCQFAVVSCPNKCEDDKGTGELHLMRKDLDHHLKTNCPKRDYECQHCGEKGTYASIKKDHDKVCDKKIVPCPNKGSGCPLAMERGKNNQHVRSVCDYTEVACAYESLGCGVRMLRKDVEKHKREAREKHIDLVLDNVSSREEQHKTLSEGEAVIFKLSGYGSKKDKNEEFYSNPFYTSPGGYKMCMSVDANGRGAGKGTHVSVFTELLKGRYDDQLHWPFLGTVTHELLNQLADEKHHSQVAFRYATNNMCVGSSRGFSKFLPHSSLSHDPATNTQYLLDDTLYFRVSVTVDNHKPWLFCTDKINMDFTRTIKDNKTLKDGEPFILKMSGYNARKATDNWIHSDSFYTSPSGYKMCIEVVPNGDLSGKGTHVTVRAKLLEGAYDASLSWPFVGTVTFTLLNQLADKNHHSLIIEYENNEFAKVGKGWGYSKFISHSALSHDPVKNMQYLKNDTLYFRVTVTVGSYRLWLVCTH